MPFRSIVEQSLAGIYVVLDERFMYANDVFAAMFGYTRDEFIGKRRVDCVTKDSIDFGQAFRDWYLAAFLAIMERQERQGPQAFRRIEPQYPQSPAAGLS